MRVINSDGAQVGILPTPEALNLAKSQGLDLLVISEQASPPVCKIVNFGQFQYQQKKKERIAKKNTRVQVIKELKLTPKISSHDYQVRVRNGIKFLQKNNLIKVSVFFKGRERARPDIGKELLDRFLIDVKEYGHITTPLTQGGRTIYFIIGPSQGAIKEVK